MTIDLVGGLEHAFYDFPSIGNFITLTNSMIFQRGRYTTNQMGIIDEWFISIFGDSYDFFWDLYWWMEGIYNQSIYIYI